VKLQIVGSAALTPMLAVGFNLGGLIMLILGIAGTTVGLRTLRPSVRDIEEYLRPPRREPGPWSNFTASSSVVLALVALLVGMMLVMFGVFLLLLAP
jgi:hypothetical protein